MNSTVEAYLKALTGAFVAGLTALATAAQSGGITSEEWITAAIAFLVGLGAVYTIPNTPRAPAQTIHTVVHQEPAPPPPTTPTSGPGIVP